MANEITIDKKHKIKTTGLDRIVTTLCFVFPEMNEERDKLIRAEILTYSAPFVGSVMAASDLYEKLRGPIAKHELTLKFARQLAKRYHELGSLSSPLWPKETRE